MYIWYGVTSDFRALPRAVAVLVMVLLPSLHFCIWMAGMDLWLIYHGDTEDTEVHRGTTYLVVLRAPLCPPCLRGENNAEPIGAYAATVSRDGRIRTVGISIPTVSSRTCHGIPSRARRSRNGSGSNSSGERTPAPRQRPCWISRAAMTGGIPVWYAVACTPSSA